MVEKIFSKGPDARGYFGRFGGQFVAETLMQAVLELERAYLAAREDENFWRSYRALLRDYVGRPSALYFAERLSAHVGGAEIWLKREDLNHTGAHKVNNTVGQVLLAKRLGKKRVIAETGAGQHGVATATVAARMGLECVVYMGAEDILRQKPNVYRMRLLGAEVVAVQSGTKTLKDAMNEALRDWVGSVEETFYVIGTAAGPHPYPMLVRDFQRVIGEEARAQFLERVGALPEAVLACVGGGSNAIGLFYPFYDDASVALYGVEAGGFGLASGKHAAPLSSMAEVGVLHGNRTRIMSNEDGQIAPTHSVSAGLDYPGVGPEHAWLQEIGRAQYVSVNDDEALAAFRSLCHLEGIIPALESSHALAYAMRLARELSSQSRLLVALSGRGDKDINTVAKIDGIEF